MDNLFGNLPLNSAICQLKKIAIKILKLNEVKDQLQKIIKKALQKKGLKN